VYVVLVPCHIPPMYKPWQIWLIWLTSRYFLNCMQYVWHTTPWAHKALVLARWLPYQASRGEDMLDFPRLTNMLNPESSSTKPHAIPLDHHPFCAHEFYTNNVQILALEKSSRAPWCLCTIIYWEVFYSLQMVSFRHVDRGNGIPWPQITMVEFSSNASTLNMQGTSFY
jgi:hypothetical protein